jgi:hypothetical protein
MKKFIRRTNEKKSENEKMKDKKILAQLTTSFKHYEQTKHDFNALQTLREVGLHDILYIEVSYKR